MTAFFRPSLLGIVMRMVPVTIIVILSFPAWLTWLFLSQERRESAIEMVQSLGRWAVGATPDHQHDEGGGQQGQMRLRGGYESRHRRRRHGSD
jgi:hypothetical protein